MTDKAAFARRLTELMQAEGLTRSDLARQIFGDYTDPKTGHRMAHKRGNVGDWVNGKKFPKPHHLEKIARFFGVTICDLVPPAPPPRSHRLTWSAVAAPDKPGMALVTVEGFASPHVIRQVLAFFEANGR